MKQWLRIRAGLFWERDVPPWSVWRNFGLSLLAICLLLCAYALVDAVQHYQSEADTNAQRVQAERHAKLQYENTLVALLNQQPVDTDAGDRVTCRVKDKAGLKFKDGV